MVLVFVCDDDVIRFFGYFVDVFLSAPTGFVSMLHLCECNLLRVLPGSLRVGLKDVYVD